MIISQESHTVHFSWLTLTELAAARQEHAPARFSSSTRNMQNPPENLLHSALGGKDTPVEGPGAASGGRMTMRPPPSHAGHARPHSGGTPGVPGRGGCQYRPAQMHQNNISLLLPQHLSTSPANPGDLADGVAPSLPGSGTRAHPAKSKRSQLLVKGSVSL